MIHFSKDLRNILILATWVTLSLPVHGQNVGINATGASPDPTAILDVAAVDRGLLIPRVALVSVNVPIAAPTTSLLVYNTSSTGSYPLPGYYYFDGTDWVRLLTGGPAGDDWLLLGNSGTNPGTGVGQNYLGTSDAEDVVIATDGTEHFRVRSNGNLLMTGDFENQEVQAAQVTWGGAAITSPASSPIAALGIIAPTPCASCDNVYSQTLPTTIGSAVVIDGTTQSITIQDGSGTDNSGVVILGNLVVKTATNGTSTPGFRYIVWLQRSNDPAFTTVTNVYKIEDGLASGITVAGNLSAGTSASTLVHADLGLAPGTYYYRMVFQSQMGSFYGLTPKAQDRSLVLMQIKR